MKNGFWLLFAGQVITTGAILAVYLNVANDQKHNRVELQRIANFVDSNIEGDYDFVAESVEKAKHVAAAGCLARFLSDQNCRAEVCYAEKNLYVGPESDLEFEKATFISSNQFVQDIADKKISDTTRLIKMYWFQVLPGPGATVTFKILIRSDSYSTSVQSGINTNMPGMVCEFNHGREGTVFIRTSKPSAIS